jgi:hypothetical protein
VTYANWFSYETADFVSENRVSLTGLYYTRHSRHVSATHSRPV